MSMRSLYLLTLLAAGGSAQAMSAGEYVAKAGDCTACHTAPGGAEFAGGYAIQGRAGAFVMSIQGSYPAVVGLPLYETMNLLTGLGFVRT